MTLKQQLISEVAVINTRLSYARNQLGKGEVIQIGSLEPEIAKLCQRIKELPAEDAKQLQNGLLGIVEELDQLENYLRDGLASIKERLGESDVRHRAYHAYHQPKR